MVKKIIYVSVRSDIGGGQEHICQLLSNIDKNLFVPYIACPPHGYYAEKFKSLTAGSIEIPFRKFSLLFLLKLCRFIKSNGIALVHCHGKGGGIYGRLAGLFTNVPVVYTFHGIHFDKYNWFIRQIYFLIEKLLSYLTVKIVHVSFSEESLAIKLKLHSIKKSVVIYNGVDIKRYSFNIQKRKKSREQLSIKETEFVIGTIARFDHSKGIEKSIEIIKILLKQIPVRYILVGDGERRKDIENRIYKENLKDVVMIAGFRNDVPDLLNAFDVYLSTSEHEGLPYTLMEAMATGVPIVASDVTGNNEVIEDNVSGYLAPLHDKKMFVEKIVKLYKDENLKKQMSQNARFRIGNFFGVNAMVKKTENLYKEILKLGIG
ncbi:MAG: glycosyltransferase [Elusimicrobiota bacterium]